MSYGYVTFEDIFMFHDIYEYTISAVFIIFSPFTHFSRKWLLFQELFSDNAWHLWCYHFYVTGMGRYYTTDEVVKISRKNDFFMSTLFLVLFWNNFEKYIKLYNVVKQKMHLLIYPTLDLHSN